jgi:GH25 family lysozyme M1 (1,4-beta-N-acetylmuramidase)
MAKPPRARGRDWSSFQRPVTKASLAGLSFGIVRVSDWSSGMGVDRSFARDWQQLRAAGLVRGAYWYLMLTPGSPSPESQAAAFVHEVKAAGLMAADLLVCDSEEEHPGLDEGTLAFCAAVAKLSGHRPEMIPVYSNLSVGSQLVKTSRQFPSFWVAWPSPVPPEPSQWKPAAWKDWLIWQNGITRQASTGEQVDADQFRGSAAELRAFVAGHAAGPAAVIFEEDSMLLNKGAGATTPFPLPNGATKVRLFANNNAEVRIDLRNGGKTADVKLTYDSAHTEDIPDGIHAIVLHRVDDGEGDVGCVVAG